MSHVIRHKFIVISLLLVFSLHTNLQAANNWFRLSTFNKTRESVERQKIKDAEEQKEQQKRLEAEKLKKQVQEIEKQKELEAEKIKRQESAKAAEAKRKAFFEDFQRGAATLGHGILWYLPNRIHDLIDCFTVEVGVGEIGVDIKLTRFAEFGAGIGNAYMTGWSVNRQNGLYMQRSYYANFLQLTAADTVRKAICGDYYTIYGLQSGTADIDRMIKEKAEDPFAIGVKAGCYVNFRFLLHPTEFADFIAGIFCIDFSGDDK